MRAIRVIVVAVVVAVLQLGGVAAPTWACACGGVEPFADAEFMEVNGETALVRYDGRTEDVLLSFALQSDSSSTALILPLPARARFELASPDTFSDLFELTKPVVEERKVLRGLGFPLMGAGASGGVDGAGGVTVIDEQDLGPFTVTQLTAGSSDALAAWLRERDFRVRDNIVAAAQPYLDEGWVIAVARLDPSGQSGATGQGDETGAGGDPPKGETGLSGDLQPVRATFETDTMVYPMRFQAEAEATLPLTIYTLTEHKQEPVMGSWTSELKYAGRLDPAALDPGSTIADLVEGAPYLTRHDGYVNPEDATADMTFRQAGSDSDYRAVEVRTIDYPFVLRAAVPTRFSLVTGGLAGVPLALVLALVGAGVHRFRAGRRLR